MVNALKVDGLCLPLLGLSTGENPRGAVDLRGRGKRGRGVFFLDRPARSLRVD